MIPRRQNAAEFAILLPAGCGVVAAGARSAEPARPGSPVAACDFAFIRSMCSTEFLAVFKDSNVCLRKRAYFGRVFRCVFRLVLPRYQYECVPEGRALSCSLKSLLCMDAF